MTTEVLDMMASMIVQLMPIIAAIGIIGLLIRLYKAFSDAIRPSDQPTEKRKHEPVSFFEPEDTEPDYVVGFGDDGELLYASEEKPKRKNDEVAE